MYAAGFARPDRGSQPGSDSARPWHAVEAHRPAEELDGEVELALCGTIVQVWGGQDWAKVGAGRTACAACRRLTDGPAPAETGETPEAPPAQRRLRIVS
jgi:hypothetical protein